MIADYQVDLVILDFLKTSQNALEILNIKDLVNVYIYIYLWELNYYS